MRLEELMQKRREATRSKKAHLRSNPRIVLVTLKECEYRQLLKRDSRLKRFHERWDCTFGSPGKKQKQLGNSEMLQAIREGKIYGVAVASVRVPSTWESSGFQHPLSPREFYEQFPPIFQTTLVGFQDVGPYMQAVLRENQLNEKAAKVVRSHVKKSREEGVPLNLRTVAVAVSKIRFSVPPPQRLLVSVMKSNRLVCSSDLLSWYDRHGLQIFVEQFVQYKPIACFRAFVQKVTRARQEGNFIQAQSMKVLGNAAYGSLLLRKDRFSNVSYVRGEWETLKAVRSPYTKKTTPLGSGVCEVETRPRKVVQDMPTALGVQVLSGAKLVMLKFYYDYIDKYLWYVPC